MWAFKTLWDKGLIYEGFRVLAYCWRCETPLSATPRRAWTTSTATARTRRSPCGFELPDDRRPGDAPAGLDDHAVDAAVQPGPRRRRPTSTTPWSRRDGARYVLAEARLEAYAAELGDGPPSSARSSGAELVGRRYTPLFDFFADTAHGRASGCSAADFVDDRGGHRRRPPGPRLRRGRPDASATPTASRRSCPMDEHGRFTAEVAAWAGEHVFDANPHVIRAPQGRRASSLRHETYDHSYPHCWRCDQPLVYRAISSWFVEVTEFRDRMVELNQQITLGARARQARQLRQVAGERPRLVDQPQPVLGLADPGVEQRRPRPTRASTCTARSPSSRRDFGVAVTDLHRPAVDELVRPNPDDPTGRSTMRRVPEVLDCWFESGSMPFAQVHYPFENREWFEDHYPGDFIVEYIGQTRGWFYTLHVLATALFDRPAFRTCVSHGIVLGDDGQKMSKSLRNYPDPMEVFDTYGADAMRWYLLSSPILRGSDFSVTAAGHPRHRAPGAAAALERVVLLHAVRQRRRPPRRRPRADDASDTCSTATCWPRPRELVEDVTRAMDAYDLFGACASVRVVPRRAHELVHPPQPRPVLGRRPGRHRHAAHRARRRSCRVAAPLLPFVAEEIYAGLHRRRRRGQRAPHRLARRRRSCPPTTSWWRRWTRSATCARRRCRCARPTACGSACRWRR